MSKKIEFKDQYKHPKWQKKRLEILERDEFACRACGCNTEMLHVHHGYYERDKMLWEYESLTLWTLCESCHKTWDEEKRLIHGVIAMFNMNQGKYLRKLLLNVLLIQNDNE